MEITDLEFDDLIVWMIERGYDGDFIDEITDQIVLKKSPPRAKTKPHNFYSILDEIRDLHDSKNADYGTDEDLYANIRASGEFGVPAWKGALIRANDKIVRLKSYCKTGHLENEGVEDSLRDLAVYFVIILDLWRQEQASGDLRRQDEENSVRDSDQS